MYSTTRRRGNRRPRMTRKRFVTKLKELYPACKHDGVGIQREVYNEHNITYGEMDYKGMEKLYKHVKKINPDINTFLDIGSGRGKLCLYLLGLPKIQKCIGVELVKERYEDALQLKTQLPEEYVDKVEFIHANILDVPLNKYFNDQTKLFVWFSNLCFAQHVTDDIFKKLGTELPVGTIICCSKKTSNNLNLTPNPNLETSLTSFTYLGSVQIEMSWSGNSTVYIYKHI